MTKRRVRALVALVALAVLASSCAFYNTFYLARKYYFKATDGEPYLIDRGGAPQAANFNKSVDYSKKVLGSYPNSKWCDDAYLLWARALLGKEDPLQTVNMLQSFDATYPKSSLKPDAEFYLGVAYRQARKYPNAVTSFDNFLAQAPKHELAPFAYLELARALTSLERYGDAAKAAGQVFEKFPKSPLVNRARLARADARFAQGDFDGARADYHDIGALALTDDDRFTYLMREADCYEAGRKFDDELALLRSALGHEKPPEPLQPGQIMQASSERYGRLSLRIGAAEVLAGRTNDGLAMYDHVLKDYTKTQLSAEAQYRIGYTYETTLDDFERARAEYVKVKDEFGSSAFTTQAQQRRDNLDRIEQFRKAGGADSLERKAEASFLTAELYLFQLDRPERALEEYRKVARDFAGTPMAAKAITAQGWVLSHKLKRKAEADSLYWVVVREHAGTESQLAARDYLEAGGAEVPDSLIRAPIGKTAPLLSAADSLKLTPPPLTTPRLGIDERLGGPPDSLGLRRNTPAVFYSPNLPPTGSGPRLPGAPNDSTHVPPIAPAPVDTTHTPAPVDTTHTPPPTPAPSDTTRAPQVPPDSTGGPPH